MFISYSHKDREMKERLDVHLKSLERKKGVEIWSDRDIPAGEEWNETIFSKLRSSRIILLLISENFIASDFAYKKEMTVAMEMHDARQAVVIPIILSRCDDMGHSFSKLQRLPSNRRFITDGEDTSIAFVNIVNGIEQAIDNHENDFNNRDIEFRKNEIVELVCEGNVLQASSRLMDFCSEFTENNIRFRIRATTIKSTCAVLFKANKENELDDQITKLLELLEEIYPSPRRA